MEFAPLAGDRVPKWVAHHAKTELGVSITPGAADLLQQAVGNDLAALAAELDKLASYTSGGEIDEAAVTTVGGVRRGETLGDFLDCVARRDAAAAVALLPHILEQPKTTAVSVVMALTTQTLALAWGEARGGRVDYFELLRGAGSVYTGRPWAEAASAWARHVRYWDASSLDAALEALLAADIALKETRLSSDEQILATLVFALCADDGDRRSSAVSGRPALAAR